MTIAPYPYFGIFIGFFFARLVRYSELPRNTPEDTADTIEPAEADANALIRPANNISLPPYSSIIIRTAKVTIVLPINHSNGISLHLPSNRINPSHLNRYEVTYAYLFSGATLIASQTTIQRFVSYRFPPWICTYYGKVTARKEQFLHKLNRFCLSHNIRKLRR